MTYNNGDNTPPWYPSHAAGSPALARWRWTALAASRGEDHPATRAALGRYLALRGWWPQVDHPETPEVIAWYRETGRDPGRKNRTARGKQNVRQDCCKVEDECPNHEPEDTWSAATCMRCGSAPWTTDTEAP